MSEIKLVPCNGDVVVNGNTIKVVEWVRPSLNVEQDGSHSWNPFAFTVEPNEQNAALFTGILMEQQDFFQSSPTDEEIQSALDKSVWVFNIVEGEEEFTFTGVAITKMNAVLDESMQIGLNFQHCVVNFPHGK